MPRRKPASGKQHKAELQLKRAIKRGDAPPPDPKSLAPRRRPKTSRKGPTGQLVGSTRASSATVDSVRRLQSAFIKLPETFLEEAKRRASELVLPRPIPTDAAILREIDQTVDGQIRYGNLSCPQRPKWRYDMSKKEVEKNEEGLFNKWLKETDDIVAQWQADSPSGCPATPPQDGESEGKTAHGMPRSTTYFERNLEVWRQLWRVTEISQILLVLLDSRCPPLHFPPSLSTYLSSHKLILVLTKVDITGPARAAAWTAYLHQRYPGVRIVQVESYVMKEPTESSQSRRVYEPSLPMAFRENFVAALKATHEEMLFPSVDDTVGPKSKALKLRLKREIDWGQVLKTGEASVGDVVGAVASSKGWEDADEDEDVEPEFLTVGVIGQPNVGKSSLLNALFGTHKVRASKTPGKTKHFQTLFWTSQIRLVDCPGLVMPNFVPMEMQVLSSILPIATISSIPSCIYHASLLLPLERIFKLTHPSLTATPAVDKRTWRGDRPTADSSTEKGTQWTAMDILMAYAEKNGWVTAKAGRPDIMRAGNAILKALAEGRARWGFWPEGTSPRDDEPVGCGVWIPGDGIVEEHDGASDDLGSDNDAASTSSEAEETDGSEDAEDTEELDMRISAVGLGRFRALGLADSDE